MESASYITRLNIYVCIEFLEDSRLGENIIQQDMEIMYVIFPY